ncbi:MAG: hypothetical protein HC945_02830, partial [Nitrosarchaeum sp.]|nr:hypothetical protein [Nitrosarchaeum sp.]
MTSGRHDCDAASNTGTGMIAVNRAQVRQASPEHGVGCRVIRENIPGARIRKGRAHSKHYVCANGGEVASEVEPNPAET